MPKSPLKESGAQHESVKRSSLHSVSVQKHDENCISAHSFFLLKTKDRLLF